MFKRSNLRYFFEESHHNRELLSITLIQPHCQYLCSFPFIPDPVSKTCIYSLDNIHPGSIGIPMLCHSPQSFEITPTESISQINLSVLEDDAAHSDEDDGDRGTVAGSTTSKVILNKKFPSYRRGARITTWQLIIVNDQNIAEASHYLKVHVCRCTLIV